MKLIILDRDGVINYESTAYIKSPDEWQPIPGSIKAIVRLCDAGFTIAVATNQSVIGRKLCTTAMLTQIHAKMCDTVAAAGGMIAGIFYCPHHPEDHCHCRKPNPGLLEEIARYFKQPLRDIPVIGDSLRDIIAAQAVGANPQLVLTGRGTETVLQHSEIVNKIPVFPDLAKAVDNLLNIHE